MANMVRLGEFGKDLGVVHEAVVTGRKVGAGRLFWSSLAHNQDFFKEVLQLAEKYGYSDLIREMFISQALQLELCQQRNVERNWGFFKKDFTALGVTPKWPKDHLCAVVLDVGLDTVEQTFEEAWYFATSVQRYSWRDHQVQSDKKHLQLLSGIKHQRGLRWRIVDLGVNKDRQPIDVRNPQTSPHSAILWAASYFPKWVQSMNGIDIPYVLISGYELLLDDYPPSPWIPLLSCAGIDREIMLGPIKADNHYSQWAAPIFLKG